MSSIYGKIGESKPDYLLSDPKDGDKIAVPMYPGNGVVKRGTLLFRESNGMYSPAAAADAVDNNSLVVLDETVDTDVSETIAENAAAYREKLEALDGEYASAVANARYKTLIFADRFPFRYLMDDYGLEYYAAFSGCSAESDPTLSTLMFLAEKLDALKLPALITIDGSNQKAAKGVLDAAKSKNVKILTLNSMQSAAGKNDTYLSIMENNLSVLKQAVSG